MSRIRKRILLGFALALIPPFILATWIAVEKYVFSDYREPRLGTYTPMLPVESIDTPKEEYDVIVVGTDPEGVAAAVSAARNGLSTLLVDGYHRDVLGGLMTRGWLNTIDMNYEKKRFSLRILNKGLFLEWYRQVEGDSFDIRTAANAFYNMVKKEPNIDLMMEAISIEPLLKEDGHTPRTVTGAIVKDKKGRLHTIRAFAVIDATQDADFAVKAGVPYTVGREDLGDTNTHMAVTAVFRLTGVTQSVWDAIKARIREEDAGRNIYGASEMSAWGYNEVQLYSPVTTDRIRMRGLNLGRQNDESVLVNALQIFGVDGTDPKAKAEARALAEQELPHIIAYLKNRYPEFAHVEYGGLAPELYVRETRHICGEYRLSMVDVLEQRDHWDRIAFGSYPVDIQRVSPDDWGQVVSNPTVYAIPYRSIVPLDVDGLLVVGKAASFDSLPHGSARVIPVGMATGEAAGAAVRVAMESEVSLRELARNPELITRLQHILTEQGMDLTPRKPRPPSYMQHEAYEGLKMIVSRGLWVGGYNNDFRLDEPIRVRTLRNLLAHFADEHEGLALWRKQLAERDGDNPVFLTDLPKPFKRDLSEKTLAMLEHARELTHGQVFMILRDFVGD